MKTRNGRETYKLRIMSKIAIQYHVDTELYDRKVCSSVMPGLGYAMPIGQQEHKLVDQNAAEARREAHKNCWIKLRSQYNRNELDAIITASADWKKTHKALKEL